MPPHSHHCRERTRNRHCRFGYDSNDVNLETSIDETCNHVTYSWRTQEDFKFVPNSCRLTREYCCHINVKRIAGGGATIYFMQYAFKTPSVQYILLRTGQKYGEIRNAKQSSSRSNPSRGNNRNDLHLYMLARVRGAVEVAWELWEFRHVRMNPTVHAYRIHLEIELIFIARNPTLPQNLGNLPVKRYSSQATAYWPFNFLGYMERCTCKRRSPVIWRVNMKYSSRFAVSYKLRHLAWREQRKSLSSQDSLCTSFKRRPVFSQTKSFENESFLPHERKYVSSKQRKLRFEARLLQWDIMQMKKYDKLFDEAVRMLVAPSSARTMLVCLYQSGSRVGEM